MLTHHFKRIFLNTFWLSILLHLLLLLSILFLYFTPLKEEQRKMPQLFIPSYVYKTQPATLQQQSASQSPPVAQKKHQIISNPSHPNERITAPITAHSQYQINRKNSKPVARSKTQPSSMLAATQDFLKQSMHHSFTAPNDEDPIYLVGDNNLVADPLIKLMGRALSAHFEYPRIAGEFGIKGRVLIRLTLHPEGYFSHVQMLQSSNNQDLDAAALYAVNAAPLIDGVNRFISSPKSFVVGFIFK